jgi:integrase
VPKIRLFKVPPADFDFLTPVESDVLLSHVRHSWRLFFLCALRTGMRAGELLALRWEDIDLERRQIGVRRSRVQGVESAPKSNRFRYVYIAADLHAALHQETLRHGYVFRDGRGQPVTLPMATNQLRRALKRAGLRHIGLHGLRHSFASQLACKSMPLLAIQMLLGHSTVEMTRRYAHLAPDFLRDVVDVLTTEESRAAFGVRSGQQVGQRTVLGAQQTPGSIAEISLTNHKNAHPKMDVHDGRNDRD